MNEAFEDYFTKGLKRTLERRSQQQANTASEPASNESVLTKDTPALADAPVFDLEHYRVELITLAIAYINNKQQRK